MYNYLHKITFLFGRKRNLHIITIVYKKCTIFYLDTLYTFASTIWIYNYPKLQSLVLFIFLLSTFFFLFLFIVFLFWLGTKPGTEAMFADLGHFSVRAVQVSYTIILPFLFLLNSELYFQNLWWFWFWLLKFNLILILDHSTKHFFFF